MSAELKARRTAAAAVVADFQREVDAWTRRRTGSQPDMATWAFRMRDELRSLLEMPDPAAAQLAAIRAMKFFRLEPHQFDVIARRCGPLKPDPDPVLRAAWAEVYETRWDRFRVARKMPPPAPDVDREFEAMTANLRDVEEATGDTATALRQLMRAFMARSGDRGVTVSMITDRLRTEHIPVSERTVRRWLAEDTDNGIIERLSHLLYRMRRPDAA